MNNNRPVYLLYQEDQYFRLGRPHGEGASWSWLMVLRDGAAIILAFLVYHWVTKGHLRICEGISEEVRARRLEAEVALRQSIEGNVLETAAGDSGEIQNDGNSGTATDSMRDTELKATTSIGKNKTKVSNSDSSSAADINTKNNNKSQRVNHYVNKATQVEMATTENTGDSKRASNYCDKATQVETVTQAEMATQVEMADTKNNDDSKRVIHSSTKATQVEMAEPMSENNAQHTSYDFDIGDYDKAELAQTARKVLAEIAVIRSMEESYHAGHDSNETTFVETANTKNTGDSQHASHDSNKTTPVEMADTESNDDDQHAGPSSDIPPLYDFTKIDELLAKMTDHEKWFQAHTLARERLERAEAENARLKAKDAAIEEVKAEIAAAKAAKAAAKKASKKK
ncbi:hypothetical protein F5X68DRAFT_279092 [Plectosphaerella plurivora]|uniref:Uncharacterized protein n=1 Tax=Plectosphaerella plurivora TaxID=936078 RepID=A0A9P8V0N3_9PEZI|nr:hypothetical protein F5X68DRAFT_279092 [Plectosphaerella plurivora]